MEAGSATGETFFRECGQRNQVIFVSLVGRLKRNVYAEICCVRVACGTRRYGKASALSNQANSAMNRYKRFNALVNLHFSKGKERKKQLFTVSNIFLIVI